MKSHHDVFGITLGSWRAHCGSENLSRLIRILMTLPKYSILLFCQLHH